MRKWQDRAAPDDPGSWFNVSGVWPTPVGTYETAILPQSAGAASAAGQQVYAFVAKTLASSREYVVTTNKIYENVAGTQTDRTGGVTIGTAPMMEQFGDVTLCVMGAANATLKSTGGNFSALAGAPNGEIVLIVDGVVLVLNTGTSADGWAASDVFDYTNWTTGEAASGRLLDTPGPIVGGCAFGGYAYAFKASSIYRGNYVGGQVKWEWHLVWNGTGITVGTGFTALFAKYYVCAGLDCMMFLGQKDAQMTTSTKSASIYAYLFDGVSAPKAVNLLTSIGEGAVLHDPSIDTFTIYALESPADRAYFYSRMSDRWGYSGTGYVTSTNPSRPILGSYSARATGCPMPNVYADSGGNFSRAALVATTTDMLVTPFLETSKIGKVDRKVTVKRATPIMRRMSGGVDAIGTPQPAVYTFSPFRELHDVSTSHTATTGSMNTSTTAGRTRADNQATGTFIRVKITFPNRNIEVDDFYVVTEDAGAD